MTIRLHFYGSFFLHNPISKFRVSVRRPLDSATSTYINIVDSTWSTFDFRETRCEHLVTEYRHGTFELSVIKNIVMAFVQMYEVGETLAPLIAGYEVVFIAVFL